LLGAPEIAEDLRFVHNQDRVINRQALEVTLYPKFQAQTAAHILEEALRMAIPIGQIRNMQEVFELEAAQDMVLDEIIAGQVTKRIKTIAFHIS